MDKIVIGTRGSTLALWQATWTATALRQHHPGISVEIERIVAPADAAPTTPLATLGTKSVFTKTIEEALLAGRIDLAVHSLKDLASTDPAGLHLGAVPQREDPRDVLVTARSATARDTAEPPPTITTLEWLASGTRVGTSAPRRRAQLWHQRPDLTLLDIRGNVDTRLRKLREGEYDALVLAAAGLHRLGLGGSIAAYIDPALLLPAGGQGALGLQVRADDRPIQELIAPLNDSLTACCVTAERHVQALLDGGCHVPIGVLAIHSNAQLALSAVVASEDGTRLIRDRVVGAADAPQALAAHLASLLIDRGVDAILRDVHPW